MRTVEVKAIVNIDGGSCRFHQSEDHTGYGSTP